MDSSSQKEQTLQNQQLTFLCTIENLHLHQKFPGRVIQDDAGSLQTLNRARKWLISCQETHPLCRLDEMELPTRVLDVNSRCADGIVRLLDSRLACANYATLSYCWGTVGNLKSTAETIQLHRSGIKTHTLPKTIRDAVAITQYFGLRYLWVDSLCIIQDDPQDWDREAQNMAKVYANAYINVSALGAVNTSQGCFMRRPAERGAVPLEYHHDDGTCSQVFATISDIGANETELSGYPASTRAWTLQERILARRTLHFGPGQMFFECAWGFRSEDGYMEPKKDRGATVSQSAFQEVQTNIKDMADTQLSGREGWSRLVTMYSQRQMAKQSDKLPAFSGLAQRYESILKDVYVAGLWKSQLIKDLHWYAESWYIFPYYRAPSWSWMSIDGPIFMWNSKDIESAHICARVLDCHVELKGQNPYGELTGGWLKIEAPLAEVKDSQIFGYEPGKALLRVFGELPEEYFDKLQIFTLFLRVRGDMPRTALLITPMDYRIPGEGQCYRRIGIAINLERYKIRCEIPNKAVVTLV